MAKQIKNTGRYSVRMSLALLGCAGLLLGTSLINPSMRRALADATCNSISECEQQISDNQNVVNQLQTQATSYQDAINHLDAQISQLQGSIDANLAQQAQLQQQITDALTRIAQEKKVLGTDIKAMYVGGQISTIEELATSKDLSSFVDAQTYRNAVQNKIQITLAQISELEHQLNSQKEQVQVLLQSQQTQQTQLATTQQQQQQLLNYTQSLALP